MQQKTPFGQRLINFVISIGVVYALMMWACDGSMSYARWPHNWKVGMEIAFWVLIIYHLFDLKTVIANQEEKEKK